MPLAIQTTNAEQTSVTLNPRTDPTPGAGRPAKLDGKPAWTVLSGNSRIVESEDGLSAQLISSDEPGETQISVKADADLGEGVEELSDLITYVVVSATAKNLGLSQGPVTPKPEPTPV